MFRVAVDYASPALDRLGRKVARELPGCTFAGVLGDRRHVYGYHRGRNRLPKTDYSVQLPLDREGPSNYSAGLDLTFTTSQMKVVTARLRKSALDPNDPRLEPIREFYGTLDGKRVFGLMKNGLSTSWYSSTADNSHLWHIHLSFFRKFCNNEAAIQGVMDVLKGIPYNKNPTPPVPPKKPKPAKPATLISDKDERAIMAALVELRKGMNHHQVKRVQAILKNIMGYDLGTVDGEWGDKTDRAFREWQNKYGKGKIGRTPDGVCKAADWHLLITGTTL